MMADAGMSASQMTGSGKDGRITKGDVIGASEAKAQGQPATATAAPAAARPSLPAVKAPHRHC